MLVRIERVWTDIFTGIDLFFSVKHHYIQTSAIRAFRNDKLIPYALGYTEANKSIRISIMIGHHEKGWLTVVERGKVYEGR